MKTLRRYLKVWRLMTVNAFSISLVSRIGALLFFLGKAFRTISFLIFLLLLVSKTRVLAGYTLYQTILFFLTFSVIDTTTQFLLREAYRFRQLIITGDFDLVLTKPISPLFRSLFGGADLSDVLMLIPCIFALGYIAIHIGTITMLQLLLYIVMVFNGFIIAFAFHVFVVSLGILTTEIDHTIMIYRDITSTGRVPIDVYREPLRGILTFIIPVGIMMSFPVKALLGLLSIEGVVISFIVSFVILNISLAYWNYALKQYSSASS